MKTFYTIVCMWWCLALPPARGQGKWPRSEPPPARADNPVDNLYLEANRAVQAKDYALAIQCWTKVLELEPDDATAHVNRAAVYSKTGEADKALADYAEAVRIDPKDAATRQYRAEFYRDRRTAALTAGGADDPGDTAGALADYREAVAGWVSGESQPAKWAREKAVKAEQELNYDLAAVCWEAVLKSDPRDAGAWFRLAVANVQILETAKAMEDCDEALKIAAGNGEALELRARLEAAKQAPEEKAVADLTQQIRIKPGPLTYMQRAQAWLQMGDDGKAAEDFTMIIWLDTYEKDGAYQYLTSIYGSTGKLDKALEMANQVTTRLHGHLGWVYAQKGDFAKAAEEYGKDVEEDKKSVALEKKQEADEKAAEAADAAEEARMEAQMDAEEGVAPKPAAAKPAAAQPAAPVAKDDEEDFTYIEVVQDLIRLSEAHYRAKMYGKALADLNEGMKLMPKDTWSMNAKAWLLATCPDEKLRNGAEAVKLAKVHGDSDTLAAAYAEAGDWEEAVKQEKEAIGEDGKEIKEAAGREADAKAALAGATTPQTIRAAKIKLHQTVNYQKENADEIKEYTARLLLYEQKKPYRGPKELDVGG